MLIGILLLGGVVGGAFVGGMALGESRAEASEETNDSFQFPGGLQDQLTQEQIDQMKQRLTDQDGQMKDGEEITGRAGLAGVVQQLDGDTLTINTPKGPLQVDISEGTTIQKTVEGVPDDLQENVNVTVVGERNEDGTVEASSIIIVPEGTGLPTGGFFGGGRAGTR
jgi:preprotein translocase subunit YajC